ncbi:MAG: hypothetical protein WDO71_24295 [Bacteroidota bacterium]
MEKQNLFLSNTYFMKPNALLFILVLFLGACSSPQKTTSTKEASSAEKTNSNVNQDGSSFENAIILKQKKERAGVDAEYKWLAENYPGYTRIRQSLKGKGEKYYDIITIKTNDGGIKEIYFDITNFFGK